jgi:outer membrane protein TolC
MGGLNFSAGWAQAPLSLDEALQLAKKNSLQLKAQAENERAAQLEEWVQKANLLPALDLSFSSTYFSRVNEIDLRETLGIPQARVELGGRDRSELSMGVRQPIFTGYRLRGRVDLAKNSKLSEATKLEVVSNEIFHRIHQLFYKAQSLYTQRKILEASLQRLNVQLENVRNLFAAEQAMAFDTLQVYNARLSTNIELENNQLNIRLAHLQMARLLDLPEVRPIAEVELPRPPGEWADLQRLQNEAAQKRPELASVRLAQQGIGIQQRLARANYFPAVYGQANFHYAKPGLNPVVNEWMEYFSAGVNLQWNLWRWGGDQKKVEEFQALQNRLQLEERDLQRSIAYEVADGFENLQFSLEQWQLAEELQAQQAERYRIVSVQHQNGVASTNDLVTAEADLMRAELQTHQALIGYYINQANLKRAVGAIGETIQ